MEFPPSEAVAETAARSFAELLSALTGAEDGLADDVATLSDESALRRQARRQPAEAEAALPEQTARQEAAAGGKRASVTVRMSRAECAQLRQRAAEAGMTVSAYLRSCTLEVEGLRAQVKQTLAELRAAQTAPPKRGRWRWAPGFKHRVSSALRSSGLAS